VTFLLGNFVIAFVSPERSIRVFIKESERQKCLIALKLIFEYYNKNVTISVVDKEVYFNNEIYQSGMIIRRSDV